MSSLHKAPKRRWPFALVFSVLALAALFATPLARISGALDALNYVAAPMQAGLYHLGEEIGDSWRHYIWLLDAREHAAALEQENFHLSLLLSRLRNAEEENKRLRGLLGVAQHKPWRTRMARVVGMDILGVARTATIDAGMNDGVQLGAPVLDKSGVVGRVVELGSYHARVLLMIDPNSSIDGRVTRTRAQGIIQGVGGTQSGEALCQFAFSLRTEDLRSGDEIVTSGLDQRFPPGLRIGSVSQVSKSDIGIFQEALIKPAADFARLEEVLVYLGEQVE